MNKDLLVKSLQGLVWKATESLREMVQNCVLCKGEGNVVGCACPACGPARRILEDLKRGLS